MKHLILTFLLLATLPASAQPLGDRGEAEWFTVEVLVFEQASDRSVPPPEPVIPDTAGAVVLEERFRQSAADDVRSTPLFPLPDAVRFLPAPDGARLLEEAQARLERSARYRPILRMAWRQRAGTMSNPMPVRVRGGREIGHLPPGEAAATLPATVRKGVTGPDSPDAIREVDGTLALVRGRYLHFHADLVFREPDTSLVTRGAAPAFRRASPYSAFPTWHIAERREIEPGQIQYFDHRRFGMIAVAMPWLAPEPAVEQPDVPVERPSSPRTSSDNP